METGNTIRGTAGDYEQLDPSTTLGGYALTHRLVLTSIGYMVRNDARRFFKKGRVRTLCELNDTLLNAPLSSSRCYSVKAWERLRVCRTTTMLLW